MVLRAYFAQVGLIRGYTSRRGLLLEELLSYVGHVCVKEGRIHIRTGYARPSEGY